MLRVATWNLWGRFGPWEARQPAIAATLVALEADVIALQEVWFDEHVTQAHQLAAHLGWEGVATSATSDGTELARSTWGNAVVARWPIVATHATRLPDPAGRPGRRSVLHVRLDHPVGPVDVFTTHLDHKADLSALRQAQVATLAAFVARHRSDSEHGFPPVLTGDLNAVPTSDEVRMLTGETIVPVPGVVFRDAWVVAGDGSPGATWHRDNPYLAEAQAPGRRLDYVLVGWSRRRGIGGIAGCSLVGRDPVGGIQPSDHYGVVAELTTEDR